jgi:hypothetical protein
VKTDEGKLKDRCRAYLIKIGAYRFSPVQQGYGAPTLDDLCCIKGRFVGIEYKAPGKKPTPRQEQTMAAIKAAAGVAFWCDDYNGFLISLAANALIEWTQT